MSDPTGVRLASLWKRRKVVIVLVAIALVVGVPSGYYLAGYNSVRLVSVQIVSATRSRGTYFYRFDINYTLVIRVTSPRAWMTVELWPPTLTLMVDSYGLGSKFGEPFDSVSDWYNHLVPGGALIYRISWFASFAIPPAIPALNETSTDTLSLSVYFHEAYAGWYHSIQDFGIVRTTSSSWTWNATQ